MEQYETISKFDRQVAGLKGGNNIETRPTTIETVALTGEAETFFVQTIRAEERRTVIEGLEEKVSVKVGYYIILKYMDKDGNKRIVLPPRVSDAMMRQRESLGKQAKSSKSKAAMKQRMAE